MRRASDTELSEEQMIPKVDDAELEAILEEFGQDAEDMPAETEEPARPEDMPAETEEPARPEDVPSETEEPVKSGNTPTATKSVETKTASEKQKKDSPAGKKTESVKILHRVGEMPKRPARLPESEKSGGLFGRKADKKQTEATAEREKSSAIRGGETPEPEFDEEPERPIRRVGAVPKATKTPEKTQSKPSRPSKRVDSASKPTERKIRIPEQDVEKPKKREQYDVLPQNPVGHAKGVRETPEPEFPPEPPKAATRNAGEEPDVRETISRQVMAVMKKKKHKNHRLIHKAPGQPILRQELTEDENSEQRRASRVRLPDDEKTPKASSLLIREQLQKGKRVLHFLRKTGNALLALLVSFFLQEEKPDKKDYSDDLRSFHNLYPKDALKKAEKAVRYYQWRVAAVGILALLVCYITAASAWKLPLPAFISYVHMPYVYLFLLTAIQIGAMLLSATYLADGLRLLMQKKWKAEALILIAAVINLLYTLQIMIFPRWGGFLPYQPTVLLMLFFGMLTRTLRYANVLYSCRAMTATTDDCAAVNWIPGTDEMPPMIGKQARSKLEWRLLNCLWEEEPSERILQRYAPFALLITLIFAVTASVCGKGRVSFLWCWSALLSAVLPGGLLTASVLPMLAVNRRLSAGGIALGGFQAAVHLKNAERILLREEDFFPGDLLRVEGLQGCTNFTPETVSLYTLTLLRLSGSALYGALAEYMTRVPLKLPTTEQFELYESGGMGAFINSDRILVGSPTFLVRSGVRIPEEIQNETGICTAINMQFAGCFLLRYTARGTVRRALNSLYRVGIRAIPAVRDFNMSVSMLETRFRLKKEVLDYPELWERVALSEPRDGKPDEPLAALKTDDISHYAALVIAGRRIYRAVRLNLILSAVSAGLGIFLTFLLLFVREATAITPYNLFLYGVVWFLPTLVLAFGARRR